MSSRPTTMSENTPLLSPDEAPAKIGCRQKKHQLILFCIMISIILGITSLLFKKNRNGSMSLRNNSKMYSNGLTTESNKSEVIGSISPTQATGSVGSDNDIEELPQYSAAAGSKTKGMLDANRSVYFTHISYYYSYTPNYRSNVSPAYRSYPTQYLIRATAGAPQQQRSSVRFIPYPYKTLGSGDSVQCQWETRHINNNNNTSSSLDFTQQNAYREGVCIPPPLSNSIHIFSSEEAIECLSPDMQQRDIQIILSGDSYMKQLYIGLADILLSKHIRDDKEISDNTERSKMLSIAKSLLAGRHERNVTFPVVQFKCEVECYGQEILERCADCIESISEKTDSEDVWVVGVGIHVYERLKNHASETLQEIQHFLDANEIKNRTIYVSPPAGNMERVYRDLLPGVAPANPSHPFLDVFQLTKSCTMENCTYSGGHRTRYVNRWKAQLLLNTLCEVYDS